jgi:septum site-determining protein MinC
MSASPLSVQKQVCFQFKASFLPCTILQITHYDLDEIAQQLITTISKAPNFFMGTPVVIDLEKLNSAECVDFFALKQVLITNGMAPIGVRNVNTAQQDAASKEGLPILAISKLSMAESVKTKTEQQPLQPTKMVTTPIRSGVQVYAKECDLIVTAAVSPGAELFADGNIHVYGTLRGRALAGVQGNKDVRIFCRSLEAELVSIAGYYLTKEDIHALSLPEGMMQIYLDNEQIRIEAI